MKRHTGLALIVLLAFSPAVHARRDPGAPAPPSTVAPREARQFDFLIGQWQVVAEPHVSALVAMIHGQPKLLGSWKAWRSFDGFGIEDELRLTDAAGNPVLLSHSMRAFDRAAGHWSSAMLDVYRSSWKQATAAWKDGQMTVTARGLEDRREVVWRSRFDQITAQGFRWQQDRSYDGGRTWDEPSLRITAQRVAAVAPR
jgi:hypothetical protein